MSNLSTNTHSTPRYEIHVTGVLDEHWSDFFNGMTITHRIDEGSSVLTGEVTDQAALYALLRKIRDQGLQLQSVTRIDTNTTEATELIQSQSFNNTNEEQKMKAVIQTSYGTVDVLQVQEVAIPQPKADEVLIKVHTATVTPSDCAFRKGEPVILKFMYGLSKPRNAIGGVEFAGVIEATGADVTGFKVGDEVFGMSPNNFGAYSEYLCLKADGPLTHKPANMSFEEATAITDGATTALTFLRAVANIQAGQKVLINGASGAVGAYAVQIAKYFGAEVTGVCSTKNLDLVTSLGADHMIDYKQVDFTQTGEQYDVIFDAIGKSSFSACKNSLTANGLYMTTVPSPGLILALLGSLFGNGKKAKFTTAGLKQSKDTLDTLADMFNAGAIRAIIDRYYPLEDIPEAHRYVDSERKRGNVIVQVIA